VPSIRPSGGAAPSIQSSGGARGPSGGGSTGSDGGGTAALDGLGGPVDGLGGPVQGFFSFFVFLNSLTVTGMYKTPASVIHFWGGCPARHQKPKTTTFVMISVLVSIRGRLKILNF
jgi:hypothetical protein